MRSVRLQILFFFWYSEFRCTVLSTMHCAKKTLPRHCPSLRAAASSTRRSSSIIGACKMYTPASALSRHRLRHTFALRPRSRAFQLPPTTDYRFWARRLRPFSSTYDPTACTTRLSEPPRVIVTETVETTAVEAYRHIELIIIRKCSRKCSRKC